MFNKFKLSMLIVIVLHRNKQDYAKSQTINFLSLFLTTSNSHTIVLIHLSGPRFTTNAFCQTILEDFLCLKNMITQLGYSEFL